MSAADYIAWRMMLPGKNVDDLIAVTLDSILKILDTPYVTQSDLQLAAHSAIAKELLRLRDVKNNLRLGHCRAISPAAAESFAPIAHGCVL